MSNFAVDPTLPSPAMAATLPKPTEAEVKVIVTFEDGQKQEVTYHCLDLRGQDAEVDIAIVTESEALKTLRPTGYLEDFDIGRPIDRPVKSWEVPVRWLDLKVKAPLHTPGDSRNFLTHTHTPAPTREV